MANKMRELQHAVIAWGIGMGIIASKNKTVHITEGIQRRLNM